MKGVILGLIRFGYRRGRHLHLARPL